MKKTIFTFLLFSCFLVTNAQDYYKVTAQQLNVRKEPNSQSTMIGYIPYGNNVEVIDTSNRTWYKIQATNEIGYVNSSYLEKIYTTKNNKEDVDTHNLKVTGVFVLFIIIVIILYHLFKPKEDTDWIQDFEKTPTTHHQQIIIKNKSVLVAIILTTMFGPFGMFYSTTKGALTMILLPILGFVLCLVAAALNLNILMIMFFIWWLIFLCCYWIICIVWAAVAANRSVEIINSYSN